METTLDPERQKQAKQYARIRRRLWLVDTIFGTLYALAWLFFSWSVALRNWLETFIGNEWLLVALYVAIFGGIYSIITLPLGYYSGFVLPHRFGQSNQTFKDWVIDQLKGLAIGGPPNLILLELLLLALLVLGNFCGRGAEAGSFIPIVWPQSIAQILITLRVN